MRYRGVQSYTEIPKGYVHIQRDKLHGDLWQCDLRSAFYSGVLLLRALRYTSVVLNQHHTVTAWLFGSSAF
jgi:hypothetical protein